MDETGPTPRAVHPHLTLSAARDDGPEPVHEIAMQIASRHKPFELVLTDLGLFPKVVYIAPRRTPRLTRLHRDVWQTLSDAGWPPAFAGQSDPATWLPHCTVARGGVLSRPLAEIVVEPFPVRVTGLATIVVGHVGKGRTRRVDFG